MDELQAFQSVFHDCFARSETRAHFLDYMVGQYSPLARKSIEPIALAVEGGRIRSLQRFLSETLWDEEQMRWNYHQLVADELGEPDGVLMFDESAFVKKGKDSAGVARQYCGTLGKVENCQVGVFAGLWPYRRDCAIRPYFSYHIAAQGFPLSYREKRQFPLSGRNRQFFRLLKPKDAVLRPFW